jgi:hypothetical protein
VGIEEASVQVPTATTLFFCGFIFYFPLCFSFDSYFYNKNPAGGNINKKQKQNPRIYYSMRFLSNSNYVTRQLVPWLQRRCPHCLIMCGWKIALIALFHIYSLMLFNKILLSFLFKKKNDRS